MIPPVSPETVTAMGNNSGRFGRGLRQLRDARETRKLVLMLAAVHAIPSIWDLIVPTAGKTQLAHHFLGLTGNSFLSASPWQPLTYGFIHANWLHLLANITCLLLLGPKIEHVVAKRTFWLLGLFSVLAGAACFMILTPAVATLPQTLVGSSAVCFGFLALLATLSPDSRFLPLFLSGRTIGLAIILANLALALLNPDLPTGPVARWGAQLSERLPGLFQVSHACHLGGALAGWLYGKFLLRPRVSLQSLKRAREKRERAASPRK